MKAYYDKPEQVKKNGQHVEDAVQRIVSIIKQLSSLVVKIRPPLSKTSLQTLIDGGIQRFQTEYRITAPITVTNPLGALAIDSNIEIFEEVLAKVLMNAWESYDTLPGEPRPIWINTALIEKPKDGKLVQIIVGDKGRGLDPEIRDHIFEPFISSKNTVGVGMGLTVARHALRNLGGEVTISDRPGGGTQTILDHLVEKRVRREVMHDD